jgi:hypothetical protein
MTAVARTSISGFFLEIEGNHDVTKAARFSADQVYRYNLTRIWDGSRGALVVIGLNPSTADATTDDPTIRRCIGFAKRERLGGLVMLNLFAFRATDPKRMRCADDPVGPDNDHAIREAVAANRRLGSVFVAAWGAHGSHLRRDAKVHAMIPDLKCFGVHKGRTSSASAVSAT